MASLFDLRHTIVTNTGKNKLLLHIVQVNSKHDTNTVQTAYKYPPTNAIDRKTEHVLMRCSEI